MAPCDLPIVLRLRFDILAKKLHAVYHSIYPTHSSTIGAVLAVGRKSKSSFTMSLGKRMTADEDKTPPLPSKWRVVTSSVTPSSSLIALLSKRHGGGYSRTLSTLSSGVAARCSMVIATPCPSVGAVENYFSYCPNEGLVAGHPSLWPSVLQPLYK